MRRSDITSDWASSPAQPPRTSFLADQVLRSRRGDGQTLTRSEAIAIPTVISHNLSPQSLAATHMRKCSPALLRAKCGHGVDARGLPRGYETCRQRGGEQGCDANSKDSGVVRIDSKELTLHVTGAEGTGGNSGRYAGEEGQRRFAEHKADDVTLPGSQGHSDTDFAGTAGHDESKDAVQTDHGQQRRQEREARGQEREQALVAQANLELSAPGPPPDFRPRGSPRPPRTT